MLDGYTESGGNGAALTVGSGSSSSVQSDLGMKPEREFVTSYGSVVPSLKLAWRHEYDNTRQSSSSSFSADPSGETRFTSQGASLVPDSAVLTVGATLLRANNLSLALRYEMQAASGFVSQSGSLRLRQVF